MGPITFTGNHALRTDEIDPMFRHADWLTLWNTPVPFTQKQLREDMDALTKRYRALGYAGVRVTTDFSVGKSVDRAAKNVRVGITINERKRIIVAFEGNGSQSNVGAAGRPDAVFARVVRRLRGGRQRRRHPAPLPGAGATSSPASTGGASDCPPKRSASSS